jgi:hypothetical protein
MPANGCPCNPPQTTKNPVRYSDGSVLLNETDLELPDGAMFGQHRTYSTQTRIAYNGVNGYNWWVKPLPYLSSVDPATVSVVFDTNITYEFSTGREKRDIHRFDVPPPLRYP